MQAEIQRSESGAMQVENGRDSPPSQELTSEALPETKRNAENGGLSTQQDGELYFYLM